MDAQRAESGEETSTGKQECGSDTNAPVSTSRAADSAQDLSAVDKDLAPLKSFRKKIKYDKYNNDHLRFAKSQTSALGREKIVFSDFVYRLVPGTRRMSQRIDPACLCITSHAIYDFDHAVASGQQSSPQRRIPLVAITQLRVHRTLSIVSFRIKGEKRRHAIRYFTSRKDTIVNLTIRTYVLRTKIGLPKKFCDCAVPPSFATLAAAGGSTEGSGVQALKFSRGGRQTICSYCNMTICGDNELRRHGEFCFHVECDPRERAARREEAMTKMARNKGHLGMVTNKITGELDVERAAIRGKREQRKKMAQQELEEKIKEIEDIEVRKKLDRRQEIERRLKGQQAMREEYQKRLCQNKHGPALKCVSCGLGIYDGNHFNVLGGAWHTACFACAECGCSFGNYGYYIRESEIAAAKEDKKRGKVCLPPKVYCFNHRKTSYLSRAFLSLTEATANLSRRVRGMPPKYWADHRGKCPNKLNSPALQQIHERGAPAAAQAATEVAVQAAAPVAAQHQQWYYFNHTNNAVCGPYKASQLKIWQDMGCLYDNLLVIRDGESNYSTFKARQKSIYQAALSEDS
jgi:hypothetical protein